MSRAANEVRHTAVRAFGNPSTLREKFPSNSCRPVALSISFNGRRARLHILSNSCTAAESCSVFNAVTSSTGRHGAAPPAWVTNPNAENLGDSGTNRLLVSPDYRLRRPIPVGPSCPEKMPQDGAMRGRSRCEAAPYSCLMANEFPCVTDTELFPSDQICISTKQTGFAAPRIA
jgi:hypothetical protein